jgi:hypothetical protein
VVSLITCPVEPHFQEIRDASHVSVIEAASLGLNSLSLRFLTVSSINSRDPEVCSIPGGVQPSM